MGTTSDPVWEVKLLQLNVSQDTGGDCGIILLLNTAPTIVDPNIKSKVASAVLVDGGMGPRCTDLLIKTMQKLEEKYEFVDSPGGKFKFDAISISHWDIDHWKGFCWKYNSNTQYNFLKDPRYGFTGAQHAAFRYDTTAATDIKPLTRFYCQEFSTVPQAGKTPSPSRDMNPDSSITTPRCPVNVKGSSILKNVLDGYWETEVILGVNLFNGKQVANPASTKGLVSLVKGNHPWQDVKTKDDRKGAPGLYIWGVNRNGLGGQNLGIFPDQAHTDTNAGSIMLLLVWHADGKAPADPKKEDLTVSLYTGADAEWKAEEPLMKWLQADFGVPTPPNPQECYRINVVKAGHHGSVNATSMDFIPAVRPDHFLISNGTKHTHPTPAVLWFMHAWFSKSPHSLNKCGPRIHCVCFPYWGGRWKPNPSTSEPTPKSRWLFGKQENKEKALLYNQFNLNFVAPDGDKEYTWWKTMRDKINEYYGPTNPNNSLKLYSDDIKSSSNANTNRQYLLSYMYQVWKDYATPDGSYYPLRSKDFAIPAGLSILNHIEVSFKTGGSDFTVQNVDLGNKARKTVKTANYFKRYKITQAQIGGKISSPSEGTPPLAPPKRKRITLDNDNDDEDDECDYEIFGLTEEQGRIMLDTDETARGSDSDEPDSASDMKTSSILKANDGTQGSPIIASSFQQLVVDDISVNDEALQVPLGSNLYYLVGGLHEQCMNLSEPVDNNGKPWEKTLMFGDEFASWIAQIFYFDPLDFNSTDITTPAAKSSFSAWGYSSSSVDGFRADVTSFCGTHWNLVWKSEPVLSQFVLGVSAFADRQSIANAIEYYGVIKESRTLVMGLDIRPTYSWNSAQNATKTFKFIDVLHLIALIDPANQNKATLPLVVLTELANIQLDLDMPVVTDFQTQDDTHSQAVQALWFVPNMSYSTTLRIDFVEHTDVLKGLLTKALMDCTVQKVRLSAVRRSRFIFDPPFDAQVPALVNWGELCLKTKIQLPGANAVAAWEAYITLDQTSITFILRWNQAGNPLTAFLDWTKDKIAGMADTYSTFSGILGSWYTNGIGSNFDVLLREVCLVVDWSGNTPFFSFASIILEMDLNWGVNTTINPGGLVPFEIEFYYSNSGGHTNFGMEAAVWSMPRDITAIRLNPDSPAYPPLLPACASPVYELSLEHLGIDSAQLSSTPIPAGLPKVVSAMDLVISTDEIRFISALSMGSQPLNDAPTLSLTQVRFAAAMQWVNQTRSIDLTLDVSASLQPKNLDLDPAGLEANAEFFADKDEKVWHLSGLSYNLTAAHIYSLFPSADRAGVMNVMKDIQIPEFNLAYTYDTAGQGFSFTADGFVTIGAVSLGIDFQYNTGLPNGLKWKFVANMDWALELETEYKPQPGNLLMFLQGMLPSSVTLPLFLEDVRLDVEFDAKIELECFRTASKRMVLSLDASIVGAEFTYIHVSPVIDAQGNVTGEPIRILKCEVNSLPNVQEIPMLSKFEQPFDQMGFVWTNQDLTRSMVDLINVEVFKSSVHSELVYRDPRLSTSDPAIISANQKDDKVMFAGSHLIVVIEENSIPTAVVDYTFKPAQTIDPDADSLEVTLSDDVATIDPGASAVIQQSKGPLNVSGLGLKYQDPNLSIFLNATVNLGVLKGSLKGFGLQFNLSSLFELRFDNVRLLIEGLGLELKDDPVSLLGEVLKKDAAYFGGVGLGIEPYSFLGGGYYGQTSFKDPKGIAKTFDTTFVFAELAGPFVELEFASLSGLTAGFGHNSHMTLPTIDNVTSFPFLKHVAGNDPLAVLNGFITPPAGQKAWFGHDENAVDEIWMAAGFTAKAFHALTVSTVLTVDFSSSDISLGLFGDAIATIPPEGPEAECFAKAEIGLLAIIDWAKGIFKVEGQLTPASFILDKDCKLQGGFALSYFFEGSGHDGDWVFSIGGYHPSYISPAWYPTPPRVGISWVVDSDVTIAGNAYFAVTPKSCMGGGKLDLTFHTGHLHAWFDAYADFLVNYKPFSFRADMGVSIGISYYVHVGHITKHFGVNFGCSLHIHGPPVAGYVHVGWSIISFDIHFGNAKETTAPLSWLEFQDLVRQDGKIATSQSAPLLIKASPTNGLMSSPDTDASSQISTADDTSMAVSPTMWYVNHATFSFDITSMVPMALAFLNNKTLGPSDGFKHNTEDTFGVSKPTDDIAMRPMQVKEKVISILNVTITNDHDNSVVAFKAAPIMKQLPTALWDLYTPQADPLSKSFSSTSAFSSANSTKPLMNGISLTPPAPIEKGPFIALDLVNNTSYDCYRDSQPPHPLVRLPSSSSSPPQGREGEQAPFAARPPGYKDAGGQEQAFADAVGAWRKSDSDTLAAVLGGWVNALGIRKGSEWEKKTVDFVSTYKPPEKTMGSMETIYVVPPGVSVGSA